MKFDLDHLLDRAMATVPASLVWTAHAALGGLCWLLF